MTDDLVCEERDVVEFSVSVRGQMTDDLLVASFVSRVCLLQV